EEQRQRGQGALAAGEQRDRLVLLPRGLGHELDAALEDVLLVEQLHLGRAAAEERDEDLREVLIHRGEGLAEQLARGEVDLADRAAQRLDIWHEVVALRAQNRLALLELLMLL